MQGLSEDVTLRPRSGRVLASAVIAVATITFVGLLVQGDLDLFRRAAAPLLLVGFGTWALFWRPAVVVGPTHVTFVNPLRTVRIAWPAIADVDTRWSLTVALASGRFTAWAAPRPTRAAAGFGMRRDQRGLPDFAAQAQHEREAPKATGAIASYLVLQQWRQYQDAGLLGAVEGEAAVVRWHVATVAVVVLLLVGWALALALP